MKRLFLIALAFLFVPLYAESAKTRDFSVQENQNTQANTSGSEVRTRRRHRRHRRHFKRSVYNAGDTVVDKSKTVGRKSKHVGEEVVDKSKTVGEKSKQVGDTVVDKTKTVGQKSKETGEKVVDKTKKVVKPPQ